MENKRLVLIDGHALLHRAYHAYPPLNTSEGELVNAVYGFTSILLSVLKSLKPEYVAVAFDLPKPTFRHREFEDYKAHRPETPQELKDQVPKAHQLVASLNMPTFEVEGFEADDVIGTLAKKAAGLSKAIEVVVVTGDKDALQLVDNQVKVFMPARGKRPVKMYDRRQFLEEYGFEPRLLVDYKALKGDPSDGIPGIKGVGPKTAKGLIHKFGNLEQIYQALAEGRIRSQATARKLDQGKKEAFLSKRLAKIIQQVPLELSLADCRLLDYDRRQAKKLFEKWEFRSLINRLPQGDWQEQETEAPSQKRETRPKDEQMGLF